jgi:zinc transport system permease protein
LSLFELEFVRDALAASLLIGLMLAVLGAYVVLRRIVFVGAALAQASAAGIALAFLASGLAAEAGAERAARLLGQHPETVAVVVTLASAALLSIRPRRVLLPSEGVIGLGYALASTLAILLIAKAPGGEGDTLLLLYGNILAVTPVELRELAILCPVVLLLNGLFRRQLLMASFNPEMARAAGVPVWRWNLLLYVMLGTAIAVGIQVAGSLLTFSYLVVPALIGVMLARTSRHVLAIAVVAAVTATLGGIVASVRWDLPSGPMIVGVLVAEAAVVWAWVRATT